MERTRNRIELTTAAGPVTAISLGEEESGTLIVALHGGGYDAGFFDLPRASLLETGAAAGHPVFALDRPGYGGSRGAGPASYAEQARVLGEAIGELWARHGGDSPGVVLIGHSIGGAVAIHIATGDPAWPLLGVAVSGVGASPPPGGEEGFADLSPDAIFEVPEEGLRALYGPDWTVERSLIERAGEGTEPVPGAEVIEIYATWPADFARLAPLVDVPVQFGLAEFETLWEATPEALDRFTTAFVAAPWIDARIVPAVGHNIDHHRLGEAWRLRQLAFAAECAISSARP
jgi:pimeloyl-ACP methyl ester carboxylesterase